jgi:creatinine amidohydrolase
MKRLIFILLSALCFHSAFAQEKLSPKWEELTAADFVKAIGQSQGVCMLPIGILEKHGAHLPLGTDLLNVRRVAADAAAKEYALIFPEYYFGQIFEARHQPGTVAYSLEIQLKLLQETTDEMARNGCRKVVIVNGHGGNESLLPLFAQAQLAREHDYVVYVLGLPQREVPGRPATHDKIDMHGGETETSVMLANRPDLVHLDRAGQESGADQHRQNLPQMVYTGIWWYAKFPNHYSGDATTARKELGEFDRNSWTNQIVEALRAIKADDVSSKLQEEFYRQAKDPLKTPQ